MDFMLSTELLGAMPMPKLLSRSVVRSCSVQTSCFVFGRALRSSRNCRISFKFSQLLRQSRRSFASSEGNDTWNGSQPVTCPQPPVCRAQRTTARNQAAPRCLDWPGHGDLDFTFFQEFGNFAVGAAIEAKFKAWERRTSSDKNEISNIILTVTDNAIATERRRRSSSIVPKISRSERYHSTVGASAAYGVQALSDAKDCVRA